jgi:hypothetical protein
MLIIDASSMIYAWDNYPIEQFPRLWEWERAQVESHELQIPSVAFDEVSHKIPDCCGWLNDHGCMVVPEQARSEPDFIVRVFLRMIYEDPAKADRLIKLVERQSVPA